MKSFLFFFISTFFLSLTNMAQLPKDYKTNKITYKAIEEVSGASKKELYTRAKMWMITNFVSGENPLNYYNEDAGIVIANGYFNVDYQIKPLVGWDVYTNKIKYTIKISAKDGKYKYEITNFKWKIISFNDPEYTIPIVDYNSLDEFVPRPTVRWYSIRTRQDALSGFYQAIDNNIKEKISSLLVGMRESIYEDDDW